MQTKQLYGSSYDVPVYNTIEADETSETVHTIRLLYADEQNYLLIKQLQTADYQSMLTWQDVLRVSGKACKG